MDHHASKEYPRTHTSDAREKRHGTRSRYSSSIITFTFSSPLMLNPGSQGRRYDPARPLLVGKEGCDDEQGKKTLNGRIS